MLLAAKYTTIKISLEDKRRLERLARLMGAESLAEALRRVLDLAERALESCEDDVGIALSTLRYARDVGEANAEDIDRYLYGENP